VLPFVPVLEPDDDDPDMVVPEGELLLEEEAVEPEVPELPEPEPLFIPPGCIVPFIPLPLLMPLPVPEPLLPAPALESDCA